MSHSNYIKLKACINDLEAIIVDMAKSAGKVGELNNYLAKRVKS